jgi:hypothetical protein
MFQVHVILDQPKGWLDYIAPLGTILAAFAALMTVFVARRIARNQNVLQQVLADRQFELQKAQLEQQERQLKKDLFDRRFAVFTDTGDFLVYVIRQNGNISLTGPEYRQFSQTMEKAQMLFGADVGAYLEDVDKTARDFYVLAQGRERAVQTGDVDAIKQDGDVSVRIGVDLLQKRPVVFRPHLSLEQLRG